MCWYSYEKPELRIAEEDITCYKVVYTKLKFMWVYSLYRNFKYTLHNQYFIKDGLSVGIHETLGTRQLEYTINEGFHSYSQKPGFKDGCIWCTDDNFESGSSVFRVKCTIPKGSVYYYNPTNCTLVSDSIIIDEIIPNEQIFIKIIR